MKIFFSNVLFVTTVAFTFCISANAKEKRTDGPPGSEYADWSKIEGELQIGAHFGATVPTATSRNARIAIGADVDYRPYDLFGIRLNFFQGLQVPRSTLIGVTPLVQSRFSNLRPYALFGPGLGVMNYRTTELRFVISTGVGADFMITDHFGFGMAAIYHFIFDSSDLATITARFMYSFGGM